MEENKNVTNNNIQTPNEPKSNVNITLIIIIIILFILLGIAGYFLFIKKGDNETKQPSDFPTPQVEPQKQDDNLNVNFDVLNYQCKEKHCDNVDYLDVKQLLKTSDVVKYLYKGNDNKNHVVLLENVSDGNRYFYLVDEDKYYFKNDNYHDISLIEASGSGGINSIYNYDYAIVHQKITKSQYETSNSKIYSFKNDKYVAEFDDYYNCSYVEYDGQYFYRLWGNGENTLYDGNFNKIIDETSFGNFALDSKYIFGVIEKNSEFKFYRYDISNKKYEMSNVALGDEGDLHWTYNYIAKYNNGEYEIYDFDGNLVFKTDEKLYLKDVKAKDYNLPCIPDLYYSKTENKVKLILNPDICGDETCPPSFGYSYYEYDLGTKNIMHKFYTDNIPDDVYQNLLSGYAQFGY